MAQIAQAKLRSGSGTLTAWVDLKPGVRVGSSVTLKGDDRLWEIKSLGRPTDPEEVRNIGRRHRDINGGLQ